MSNMENGRMVGELPHTRPEKQTSGICAGVKVMTLDGEIPVEFLNVGDRVVTRDGALILRRITKAVLEDVAPVIVRADTLGLDRPDADLVLPPSQQILIRDWRAKALYGQDQALVPADRLVDGEYISRGKPMKMRVFTLHFDTEQVVYAGGLELAAPAVEKISA